MKKPQKIAFSSFFAMVLSGLAYCMAGSPLILSALVLILVFIGIYFSLNYAEKPNSNHLNIAVNTSPDLPEKTNELDTFYERENYRREFVGNVAHELKTPLFSIQGYLLTLIEGGVDDESIRDKYLHRINKSVERLTYIVKDLDLITELESGNLKLDIYPFNIVALVQEVFELLEIKAENNDVKLIFDKTYDEPIKVNGDIEKIEQVLMNLIVNAINHSRRACEVKVSFQVVKDLVRINISDTGMGIKPEEMKRIFERFYRADKSRSRQQGGSGLGLAIVKHILEAHNQKILAESTYGEGTTFSFYLEKA
ncbi:ATP-binding protein [Ornithobacterium rhinotracheale]|uniref:sensor histidine kinase n=1 Tax=Ornithobacterium rhinotracheale TaxID=28251 RepID=UPI001FBA7AC2|nr:ATP-binding protein [Ornithobacterium rhinotracheale]UOH77990.1 ATP-binding protein [Ornithobacterium rhinotracheale]